LEVGRIYSVAEIRDKFDSELWRLEEKLKAQGRIQQVNFDLEVASMRLVRYEAQRRALAEYNPAAAIVLDDVIRDLRQDIEYLQQRKKDLLAILCR
jgi:hypothetical protein